MDVVKTIINNIIKDVPILVHSMNQTQGPLMADRLSKAGFYVTRMPMYQLTERIFKELLEEVIELWEDFVEDSSEA